MGRVYAAYDEELDRKVALKVLHRSQVGDGEQRSRILREAQAMARVSHPNVVHVYGVSEAEGELFIAMEFIDGQTLARPPAPAPRYRRPPRHLPPAGHGLLAAHQAGLVHRDFKPDNVLIGRDGRPRVADFGLARPSSWAPCRVGRPWGRGDDGAPTAASSASSVASATSTGTVWWRCGGGAGRQPAFVSAFDGRSAGGDAGLYGAGTVRGGAADGAQRPVQLLRGALRGALRAAAFSGDSLAQLAANVVAGRVDSGPRRFAGRRRQRDPSVDFAALQRGLAVDPAKRFPSMADSCASSTSIPHSPQAARSCGADFPGRAHRRYRYDDIDASAAALRESDHLQSTAIAVLAFYGDDWCRHSFAAAAGEQFVSSGHHCHLCCPRLRRHPSLGRAAHRISCSRSCP